MPKECCLLALASLENNWIYVTLTP